MIDYEKEFQKYISVWMENAGMKSNMYQVVDDHLVEIYEEWLHTPQETFGGKMPHHFFDEIKSAKSCFKLIEKYIQGDVSVPGPLLNRMVDLKDEGYPLLIEALDNKTQMATDAIKTNAVAFISEMDKPHPLKRYIAMVKDTEYTTELIEAIVDVLKINAAEIKDQVIVAYLETPLEFAKDTFLDILSELMFDTDAYKHIFENFVFEPSKCGMYAHMLSKVGIADCVEAMEQRLKDPNIGYLSFCRVKEALEELGGETSVERDFANDVDYEYMRQLAEEKDQESEDEVATDGGLDE